MVFRLSPISTEGGQTPQNVESVEALTKAIAGIDGELTLGFAF
jgi:hypothetical protein